MYILWRTEKIIIELPLNKSKYVLTSPLICFSNANVILLGHICMGMGVILHLNVCMIWAQLFKANNIINDLLKFTSSDTQIC